MKELDYTSKRMENAKKVTSLLTDYVNGYDYASQSEYFNEAMSREHRTLQQSFTRLALRWLEYVASEEYRYDDRNHDSHVIAEDITREFGKFIKTKYGAGATPDPHRYIGTV